MRDELATQWAGETLSRWAAWVMQRPRAVLAAFAGLLVLSALAAAQLRVDTDSSRMLASDLPFQERAQELNAAFPQVKNTVAVVIRGPRADPVEAAAAALAERLAAVEAVAEVFAPSADPFFLSNGFLYLDPPEMEARLIKLSKAANLIAALRADPTFDGFLAAISEAGALAERAEIGPEALDGLYREAAAVIAARGEGRSFAWTGALSPTQGQTVRVVSVLPKLDFTRVNAAKPALQAIAAEIAALDPTLLAEVEIGVTGDPALRAEELTSVTARIGLSLGLSVLLVAVVLWLALGTAARVGLALGTLAGTLVLTAGFAGAAVGALNLISIAFIVLMVGLGIDFAIHVLAHLDENSRTMPARRAMPRTAQGLGGALVLTALSTSAAFLAFTGTDFAGMAQLGLIGAAGVALAFGVTVTVVPAAVALWPGLAKGRPRGWVPALGAKAPGGGRRAMWLALALGLGAAVIATEARFDADPMGLRDPAARSVQVYGWLAAEPELAPLRLGLLAPAPADAEAAATRLSSLPEIRRAVWLGDLIPEDQDDKLAIIDLHWPSLEFAVNGTPANLLQTEPATPARLASALAGQGGAAADLAAALTAYAEVRSPEADAAIEAALFRHFPMMIDRLARMLDIGPIAESDLPAALRARYLSAGGQYRVEISPTADISDPNARRRFIAAVAQAAPEAAGPPAQIEGAAVAVAGAMVQASLIALAAAAALAFAALRSLLLVGAILVPVALAGAVTMAASVLLGMPFNYANIIVLPLLIGLGIDSGIHLALRSRQTDAVFATSTPRAVAYSALTTIGAFATLALSDHRGTASMGAMLAIALVAAVAMTFALTPPLVRLAERARRR